MINKLNSCSLWTHSHWAKTIIFHLDRNMINRFHFIRGILTEISCEFVSARIVKSTQLIIRVKKESSYLSRLDFEFSYVHGQQLQRERKLQVASWISSRIGRRAFDQRVMYAHRQCASSDSTNQNALFVEWFERMERAIFSRCTGEVFALFQACVGNFDTIPQSKVVGTPYLDSSYVYFKYFAFLSVCRLQNSPYFCVFKYVSSLKFIRLLRVVFSSQQLRE